MRAPLIAVISVGIAAAAPAVAISANTPSGRIGQQARPGAVKTDLHQPLGRVTIEAPTRIEIRHRKLARKYLKLRTKATRLAAKVHHRKVRGENAAIQIRWSNHRLGREVHALERSGQAAPSRAEGAKRPDGRDQSDPRADRRLRVARQPACDRRRRRLSRQVSVHVRSVAIGRRRRRPRCRAGGRAGPKSRPAAEGTGHLSVAGLRLSTKAKRDEGRARGAAHRPVVRSPAWTRRRSGPSFPCSRPGPT